MKYEETEEFKKDLKRLMKKYRSLSTDLDTLKQYCIDPFSTGKLSSTPAIVKIEGMCAHPWVAYKVRRVRCESLRNRGNNSGLRLIYIFHEIEQRIIFVELYAKSDKANEDRERLKRAMEQFC